MEQYFRDYGWAGVLLFFGVKEFWPVFSKWWTKEADAKRKLVDREVDAKLAREESDRADRRKRDDDDRQWNRQMMERLVKATEESSKAQVEFNLRLALMQRLAETTPTRA